MRNLFASLALLSALTVASASAHADILNTFSLHVSNGSTILDGFVDVDITVGKAAYGVFTLSPDPNHGVRPDVTIGGHFSGPFCLDCVDFPDNSLFTLVGPGSNYLEIQLPASLIGYMGGSICSAISLDAGCDGAGQGTYFVTGNTIERFGDADLVLEHTVPNLPEPSSLALFGTGALGFLGVLGRRFRFS